MRERNETSTCVIGLGWAEHREEVRLLSAKVADVHAALPSLMESSTSSASALTNIANIMLDIRNTLLDSATGRDQMPTKTATLIFNTLGLVILVLLITLGFLLIGENFSWIKGLHR